jgi:glycosyltransferase involved in cell wall biosynthesis
MKRILYRLLRGLFMVQQRVTDAFRTPPDAATRGAWYRIVRWTGGRVLSAGRVLIKPSTRAKLRLFLVRLSQPAPNASAKSKTDHSPLEAADFEGINLVGYLSAELGLGESARSTIRAAKEAGIQISGFDFKAGCAARLGEEVDCEGTCDKRFFVNLFHLNADQLPVAHTILGAEFFFGHFNIAYCVWEQSEFPEEWTSALDLVGEVWTASTFCADVLSRKTSRPVVRIPHNVQPVVPAHLDRSAFGLPEDGFIFLGMADFYSTPERKNPLGSLEAYVKAYTSASSRTYFALKILNSHSRRDFTEMIADLQASCPSIILIDKYLSRQEVNALLSCCDCFVSLHRSEGFGLPIAEAMYLGKPVIATGWSGNMDFMNVGNSFPVRYRLVSLDRDVGPYRKGFYWAEPDLEHAAELMKKVSTNGELAVRVGEEARIEIRRNFSPAKAGELMKDRLKRIRDRHLP